MPTCRTCRFWTRYKSGGRINYLDKGGICASGKLSEDYGKESYGNDCLVYSYEEGGHFWTGPSFGCVHHTPIPKAPHAD